MELCEDKEGDAERQILYIHTILVISRDEGSPWNSQARMQVNRSIGSVGQNLGPRDLYDSSLALRKAPHKTSFAHETQV